MSGKQHFNDIARGLPLMSRTMLSQRLRQLRQHGLVQYSAKVKGRGYEYSLTPAGQALQPIIMQIGDWGREWVYPAITRDNLDPYLLMRDIHMRFHMEKLPGKRTVLEFNLRGMPGHLSVEQKKMKQWWMVLENAEVQLCLTDPGYEVQLVINADLMALTQVWMGEKTMDTAVSEGRIVLLGNKTLVRGFPRWLKLSVFAQNSQNSNRAKQRA